MELNYKVFGEGFPLIILHGLLGSLDNWQGIAKAIAGSYKVYIVDQRNHGRSGHSDEFSYSLMVADLEEFYTKHHIEKAHIIGHSMGGKTAMQFAFKNPGKVEKLIVVDVAPVHYEDRHSHIFKGLLGIDLSKVTDREEVERQLREATQETEDTIQFLMKGLHRNDNNVFEWRFNVPALWKAYNAISDEVTGAVFEGKTLFIKGQQSNYITAENYGVINDHFPNNELTEIEGAGHWVHAEKPKEFTEEVMRFLQ
jgi:esterase